MKLKHTLCAISLVAVSSAFALPARADGNVSSEVLVRVQPGVDIQAYAADHGTAVLDSLPDLNIYDLRAPTGGEDTYATQLAADPRTLWAETEDKLPETELRGKQYHFAFDKGPDAGGYVNQGAYSQVNVGAASSYTTGSGTIVAVLDTGATFTHPALQGVYLPGYNVLNPTSPPDDVADGTTNAAVGHGTMIAGIVARIAPDARILPVRVMNGDGTATMMQVAKGLHYAVKAGARVVVMSFGSSRLSEAMKNVIDEAKAAEVVMVGAAGNDGTNQIQYPALRSGVMAVASVEADDVKSDYSNYGPDISVVAPGTGIRSTYADGGYASWSGTSFSVPFVAAEAALVLSEHPALTASAVAGVIQATAHSVTAANPSLQGQLGAGIIDIAAAAAITRPHVLWTRSDGAVSLWSILSPGAFVFKDFGPYPDWTAAAMAVGTADGLTRILWRHTSGKISLWTVNPSGSFTFQDYGPFDGWSPQQLAVGPDNKPRILWISNGGAASLWTIDAPGSFRYDDYPVPPGASAAGLTIGPDNQPRILWSTPGGGATLWTISAPGTAVKQSYGPYASWTVTGIAVGGDNLARIMWVRTDGKLSLWTFGTNGVFTPDDYGPYPGWTPAVLAVGQNNLPRILWRDSRGAASLWTITSPGTFTYEDYGPYPGWMPAAVTAGIE